MTARDFVYWLQGYLEVNAADKSPMEAANVALNPLQVQCVKRHLAMVFKHEIDPSMGDAAHQAALSAIHEGQEPPKPQTPRPPHYDPGKTLLRC